MQLAALEVSWGISAEAEDKYLILEELTAPGSTRWFSVRDRITGTRRWLEAAADAAASAELNAVAAKLAGLQHPHLLLPAEAGKGYIAYEWRGETPLSPRSLGILAATERIRIAGQLVGAMEYLQGLASPLCHGRLELASLWVTPTIQWLRLAQMSATASNPEAIAAETAAGMGLVEELVTGPGLAIEQIDQLNNIRDEFEASGHAPWKGLRALLTGMYVGLVSKDI